MTKTKVVFHEFSPEIYPAKLWIVKDASTETIIERFDPNTEYMESIKVNYGAEAVCFPVIQKNTGNKGVLCNIITKKLTYNIIAHESVHCADYFFEAIGAYSQGFKEKNEPYAYLVGWIADCFSKI